MKKWLYLIPPLAGLGAFVVVYTADLKKMTARTEQHKIEVARLKAEDDKKKAEAEAKSQESMAEKGRKKKADDAKKVKDREDADKAKRDEIASDTKDALDMVASRNRQIMALERDLKDLQAKRTQANNEFLATVKTVESLKEERRKAEFDYENATAKVQAALANNPILTYPDGWSPGNIPTTAEQAGKEAAKGVRKTTDVGDLPGRKKK